MFIQQGGNNRHEDICEDLSLFANDVMPEFKAEDEARLRRKADELAPFVEAAMKRKERVAEMKDDEIPAYPAYGYNIAEIDVSKLPEAQQQRLAQMRKMREIVARFDEREAGHRADSR